MMLKVNAISAQQIPTASTSSNEQLSKRVTFFFEDFDAVTIAEIRN